MAGLQKTFKLLLTNKNKLLNFTCKLDHIWNLIQNLVPTAPVFAAGLQGHIFLYLQVNSDNKCELATAVLHVSRGLDQPPTLSGTNPLKLLIGAGIHKLQTDYSYIFTSK